MTPSSTDQPTGTDPGTDPHEVPPPDGIVRMSKLNLTLLVAAIASICAGLYLSPVSAPLREEVQQQLSLPASETLPGGAATGVVAAPSGAATATGQVVAGKATTGTGAMSALRAATTGLTTSALLRSGTSTAGSGVWRTTASGTAGSNGVNPYLYAGAPRYVTVPGSGSTRTTAPTTPPRTPTPKPTTPTPTKTPTKTPTTTPTKTPTTTPATPVAKTKCWEFTWQQDAQAVYVSNLSDPYGLDGAPGPYDSDGIACSDLPVDPSRSPSTPVGQYVPRKASAETKADIVGSREVYYGFTQDGLPGDTAMFDSLERSTGKAPSTVGWYQSFDQTYRGDLVSASWSRGALPVVTWMPMDSGTGTSYSLTSIINGDHDAYLRKFAGDIVRTNLPVVIRFGHEMNGKWYGWSSGRTEWNNSPEKYKAAWIHAWKVFDSVGANDDAIWLWSPSRVDNLNVRPGNGLTAMADSYPGDEFVDWMGASAYLRQAATGPTYDATFLKTLTALKNVSDKPIFLAETGSIETDGSTDEAALKTTFIRNTLAAFAADSRIVGFLWNNNVSTQVVDGQAVRNDWRFDSNPTAAKEFVAGIVASRYRTGLVSAD